MSGTGLPLCVCLQLCYCDEQNKKCSGVWILSQDTGVSWAGIWFWVRWKTHLSDQAFLWYHLFAANWVFFQGRLWRASCFKMPQKTQTCLWPRSNGFCLKHFWVMLLFQYQLNWLLSHLEVEKRGRSTSKVTTGQVQELPSLSHFSEGSGAPPEMMRQPTFYTKSNAVPHHC